MRTTVTDKSTAIHERIKRSKNIGKASKAIELQRSNVTKSL
jgi:hypothetical protein